MEIAAKIHDPSMQFPQNNCRVFYPRVSSLYETDLRKTAIFPKKTAFSKVSYQNNPFSGA
jgi:hypothetical protein